jgi:hypothetical protein
VTEVDQPSATATPTPLLPPVAAVPSRLRERARGLAGDDARARLTILVAWALSRCLVFATAALVQATGAPRGAAGVALNNRAPLAVLQTWDGRWYQTIASHGYLLVPGRQSDPAFFPLLPIVLKIGRLAGLSYGVAYLVVSSLAFGIGLLALYELVRNWLPEPIARRATIYAAIFPMSFVFSMMYPEAIAFATIALAGVFAIRRRWGWCAACAAVATLARPEGALLIIPIAASAAKAWPSMPTASRGRAIGAVLSPVASLVGYSGYLWWSLGQPFAWTKAQAAWGRSFHVTGVYAALVSLLAAARHHQAWLFRDGAFCLVFLACLAAAWRAGVPRAWIVAGAVMVLLPLTSGALTSDARFGLLALPVYPGLASLARTRWIDLGIRCVSIALLIAGVETIVLHWP